MDDPQPFANFIFLKYHVILLGDPSIVVTFEVFYITRLVQVLNFELTTIPYIFFKSKVSYLTHLEGQNQGK